MIQVVRRSIVDVYSQYSFNRQSLAYGSQGKLYHLHNARFEPGLFGQAVLVEEGTTNLHNNGGVESSDLSQWQNVNGSSIERVTSYVYSGNYALKMTHTDPNTTYCGRGKRMTITASVAYTVQAMVYIPTLWAQGVCELRAFRTDTWSNLSTAVVGIPKSTTTKGQWVRLAATVPTSNTYSGDCIFAVYIQNLPSPNSGYYIFIDNYLLEQKPYPTSFIDDTRSPETLTIPTAGVLNPQEGTDEKYIKLLRSPGTNEQFIFDGAGAANQNLQVVVRTDGKIDVRYGTGSATVTITGTTVLAKDTLYAVAWWWSSAGVALLINGTVEASSATAPSLSFGANAYYGSRADGTLQLDGLIDDLRFSSRARTDAEISAAYSSNAPLPVDADTTLKLNFDGPDAQRAAKVLVV